MSVGEAGFLSRQDGTERVGASTVPPTRQPVTLSAAFMSTMRRERSLMGPGAARRKLPARSSRTLLTLTTMVAAIGRDKTTRPALTTRTMYIVGHPL